MKIKTPTEFLTFNSGICDIYKVKANRLDAKMYTLRFGERVTGIKRFYMAYAADVKINKVIHVPLKQDIQRGDRVVIGDIQYSIEQAQQFYDTNPPVSVLTLMKIGKAAVI